MNLYIRVTGFYVLFVFLAFTGCQSAQSKSTKADYDMATTKITIKEAKAQRVWEMFRQISHIPRCSKSEKQIIEWLMSYGENHKLNYRNDQIGNVVIELPATVGYEKSPVITLQSHVDMVCEKTPESKHDFTKDPIKLIEQDGWICADGTTLGADNGIGVALAMALIDEKVPHPKIELLFTVDEETGLTGANALQKGFITGKYLINLDGEDESFIIGCAGGQQTEISLKIESANISDGFEPYMLRVSGLHGGHSGVDIDKNYANAIKILAKTLNSIQNHFDCYLCSLKGGKAANAIPRDAETVMMLHTSDIDGIQKIITEIDLSFKKEFYKTEPNLKIELRKTTATAEVKDKIIINNPSSIINLLMAIPNGVYQMSDEFKGTVETSNNLASIETINGKLHIKTMQRGFNIKSMNELTDKIIKLAQQAGAEVEISNRYPVWKPNSNSLLLKKAKEVYKKLYGKEPLTRVVHAGLEPAVVGEKFPEIEMISIGPTIQNPHSPFERVNIASVDRAREFLLAMLPSLK